MQEVKTENKEAAFKFISGNKKGIRYRSHIKVHFEESNLKSFLIAT